MWLGTHLYALVCGQRHNFMKNEWEINAMLTMNLNMLSNASSQVMSSGFKVLWKHLVSDARCIRTTQILAEYTENMIIRRDMYKKFHLSQTRKRTSEHNFYRTHMSLAMKGMTLNHHWLQPEQRNALEKCYEQHNYLFDKLHWEFQLNWIFLPGNGNSFGESKTDCWFYLPFLFILLRFLVYLFQCHINLSKPTQNKRTQTNSTNETKHKHEFCICTFTFTSFFLGICHCQRLQLE